MEKKLSAIAVSRMENPYSIVINVCSLDAKRPMRVCPHCKQTLPLSEYGFRRVPVYGLRLQSWCTQCRKEFGRKEIGELIDAVACCVE